MYSKRSQHSNRGRSQGVRSNVQKGQGFDRRKKWKDREGGSKSSGQNDQKSKRERRVDFLKELRANTASVDDAMGFARFSEGEPRLGWLLNMLPSTVTYSSVEHNKPIDLAALELYFLQQDGGTFRAQVIYRPYFYVLVKEKFIKQTKAALERMYSEHLDGVEIVELADLAKPDHLTQTSIQCLQLLFRNVEDLRLVRSAMQPIIAKNAKRSKADDAYAFTYGDDECPDDLMTCCLELREYDVQYYTRVSIDLGINVGAWYTVTPRISDGTSASGLGVDIERQDIIEKAEARVLAFDIECTKQPLKFPDAEFDQVFMISYVFDGQGYLIINREHVSADISDFEYTPKPEYPGPFEVFNEADERATLERFFTHCKELRPNIWVTYNGDFFDWPFVETRAKVYGMNMHTEIGVRETSSGVYTGSCAVHMDCFHWVQRDSYLPAGSRGLKAVTKAKLGYDPVEVDPEEMVQCAKDDPHRMASYSVSDAVATYYLFDKYVNLFIFSLCTIIPLGADDVLRKGSGTLCEMLLMTEARRVAIICPNKYNDPPLKFSEDGQLLTSESYVGGHVESLLAGVYRSDLKEKFRVDPAAFDELIENIDRDLTFAIEVESGVARRDVVNYDEVRGDIIEQLELLRDTPVRSECPAIYHLDVAAMYPNIILTNRLQPCAVVNETICASCSFNSGPDASCKRNMEWMYRVDSMPATKSEFNMVKNQLQYETFDEQPFHELGPREQAKHVTQRMKQYCKKNYGRIKDTKLVKSKTTICQRENPFYVDTVKAFRDRRYEYKGFTKKWGKQKAALENDPNADPIALESAKNKYLLFDSLQLAHKCILNSFYGYVMRKGARWYSMEMAGVVTHTGGNLIKQARKLVERIGRTLELDTDGIWCILPGSFPENFSFKTNSGKKIPISYPCVMLNADIHASFTNHQYQNLVGHKYETHDECSIYFEVDGPYRCMVLPSSTEEGKLLKKRYAVFNFDGSLAELKGFELKRRGELDIVKNFQSEVFAYFLEGKTLEECYQKVGNVATYWMEVLMSKGKDLSDEEVIGLLTENRSMSRNVEDYGDQKSNSISTAKRLTELLGEDMSQTKGLACKLIIANKPDNAPTTERAIPTAVFARSTSETTRRHFLRRWLKDNNITNTDIREIIDWGYYIDRLAKSIQKIITIPAGLQHVANPVPLVPHPPWLQRKLRELNDSFKQQRITSMFKKRIVGEEPACQISEVVPDVDVPVELEDSSPKKKRAIAPSSKAMLDIEDMFGKSQKKRVSFSEEISEEKDQVEVEEEEENDEDTVDKWLEKRRKKWKSLRDRHKSMDGNRVTRGLSNFIAPQERIDQTMDKYWQVLEVRELNKPGLFKVFAMTDGNEMKTLYIKMRRSFYINSNIEQNETTKHWITLQQKSTKHYRLPHGHKAKYLYRVEIDEEYFRKNAKDLTNFVASPEIAGVYEMSVPLHTRMFTHLGCVAQLHSYAAVQRKKEKRNISEQDPLAIGDIKRLVCATNPYLEKGSASFKRIFIYQAGEGDRQIIAMFTIKETSTDLENVCETLNSDNEVINSINATPKRAECLVWITKTPGAPDTNFNVTTQLKRLIVDNGMRSADYDLTYSMTSLATSGECWDNLDAALGHYSVRRRGPTCVVLQTSLSKEAVFRSVGNLGEFPCVWIQAQKEDNILPTLQWQLALTRRCIEGYIRHSLWLNMRIKCSRYAHIPVSHVGEDFAITMTDTFYTRLLDFNKHVIWASPSNLPDLGGAEEDLAHATLCLGVDSEFTSVTVPGTYNSYCVEIDILHLAINTVLQARYVHDIECEDGSTFLDTLSVPLPAQTQQIGNDGELVHENPGGNLASSLQQTVQAFQILYRMVTNWKNDLNSVDGSFADHLMIHFYRWLCSPRSLLYDPALHQLIHQMMTKVFLQLLAELRNLNAKVVAANFQKIWLCTEKNDTQSAEAYCKHIIMTVNSKTLFQDIEFEIKQYWQGLVFLDEENYGGVQPLSVPSPVTLSPEEADVDTKDKEEFQVECSEAAGVKAPEDDIDNSSSVVVDKGSGNEQSTDLHNEPMEIEEHVESLEEKQGGDGPDKASPAGEATPRADEDKVHDMGDSQGAEMSAPGAGANDDPSDGTKTSLRRRAADGSAVTTDTMTRHTLADEQERVRRMKAGEDSDEEEEIEHGDEDMEDFIVDDEKDDTFFKESKDAEEGMEDDDAEEEANSGPGGKYELVVNWNICNYLPVDLHDYFLWIIGEFILEPVKFRDNWFEEQEQKMLAEERETAEDDDDQAFSLRTIRVTTDALREAEAGFMTHLIQSNLSQKLLPLVQQVLVTQGGSETFPKLAGSYLKMKNPALEFIKFISHVLKLDKRNQFNVQVLRRSMLKMIDVKEFSPDAEFRNPSLSLMLRDVICSYCTYTTDLDLCRNTHIMSSKPAEPDAKATWTCVQCGHHYDMAQLESTLVERVEKLNMAFQLQDLECNKCGDVRPDNMSETCSCSGEWVFKITPSQQKATLLPYQNVADYYHLEWLGQTTRTYFCQL